MTKVVDFEWINTKASEDYVNSLFSHGRRKQFGLLEKPSLPPNKNISFVKYNIFLSGKAGVGKSSTVHNLLGTPHIKASSYSAGISIGLVYWPVRLISTGQILFFTLNFWDAGDYALKKFEHILPACIDNVDCIMYTFSFIDRHSFNEITQNHNMLSHQNYKKEPLRIILGTKADKYSESDITDDELKSLSDQLQANVLRIQNVEANTKENFVKNSTFLNSLCDFLWLRDEKIAHEYSDL